MKPFPMVMKMKMYRLMIWVRTAYRCGVEFGDFLQELRGVLVPRLVDDQCVVVLRGRDELPAVFRAADREDDREFGVLFFHELDLLVFYR